MRGLSRAVRSSCPYSRLNSRFFGARSSVGREADSVEDGVIDCGQYRIRRNCDRITFHIRGRVLNERGPPIHPASSGYHTARAYFQGGGYLRSPCGRSCATAKKEKPLTPRILLVHKDFSVTDHFVSGRARVGHASSSPTGRRCMKAYRRPLSMRSDTGPLIRPAGSAQSRGQRSA